MRNTTISSHRFHKKSDWGRIVSLTLVIPLAYLFLPNFLVGQISVELKAYLGVLIISVLASFAIYRSLNQWDAKIGLLNDSVSETKRFWSFWGIGLSVGSLLLSSLVAINSIGIPTAPAGNNDSLRPQFKDSRAQEFCPLGIPEKAGQNNGTPFLCVLILHAPNLSVFVGGDVVTDDENCVYYDIQSGRLGMKFLAQSLTCLEQKSIEISEKLRTSAEHAYSQE